MSMDLQTQIEWMLAEKVKRGIDTFSLARSIIDEVRREVIAENARTIENLLSGGFAPLYHGHDSADINEYE